MIESRTSLSLLQMFILECELLLVKFMVLRNQYWTNNRMLVSVSEIAAFNVIVNDKLTYNEFGGNKSQVQKICN